MTDHDIILEIQQILNDGFWTADTVKEIAHLLENNGYHIMDVDDDK